MSAPGDKTKLAFCTYSELQALKISAENSLQQESSRKGTKQKESWLASILSELDKRTPSPSDGIGGLTGGWL